MNIENSNNHSIKRISVKMEMICGAYCTVVLFRS